MENLKIYDSVRDVPKEAQKTIKGGRINGMTDINPMWRLKKLTETFGVVGFGWKYEIVRMWIEKGANNEESAFVQINLFVKQGEQWSEAIPGIGGSSFVANESKGLYTSDECYKMALTDAISVSCKSLGMGADIYFAADRTKYDSQQHPAPKRELPILLKTDTDHFMNCKKALANGYTLEDIKKKWTIPQETEIELLT